MSDRQPPSEWTKAAVAGVFWLAVFTVPIFVMKGFFTGAIRPADIAAQVPHYRDVLLSALVPTLAALAAGAALIGVGLLAARHGRTWVAVWWRYRRRWAHALAAHDLTTVKAGRRQVPDLLTVTALDGADVARVRMLEGQSPQHWAGNAAGLASAFGATDGRVHAVHAHRELDLMFTRDRRAGQQPALAAGGAQMLALPTAQRAQRPVAIRIRAYGLQICWARVQILGPDGQTRRYWGARGRWSRWATKQQWVPPQVSAAA
ncbi:hypothetical protein [Nocardia vaccinii]|uniref:hypothetical protein n=1 Tax=Nocardia vaccinii TaxID=1822 RepID=UPI000834BAE5|nr:hypothetical protein [Nocardia vaccinii]